MNEIKVSVIIPVYNCEKYIKKCVTSIIKQSYKNIEILLINDGSTDNSYAKCKEIAILDERIKVFSKDNGGVSSARNYGLKKCEGDYILFIDGDDYITNDCIEKSIKLIKEKDIEILKFSFVKEISKSIHKKYSFSVPINKVILNKEYSKILYPNTFLTNDFCNITNVLIKKEIINHDFEPRMIGEDFLFFMECLIKSKNVYFINDIFYHYVVNENSATHIFDAKKHFQKLADGYYVNNKIKELVGVNNLSAESYVNKVYSDFYSNIVIFIQNNNYQKFCDYIDKIKMNFDLDKDFQNKNITYKKIFMKNKYTFYKMKIKEKTRLYVKIIITKLFRKE